MSRALISPEAPSVTDTATHLVLLRASCSAESDPDPPLDRWLATILRHTEVAHTGLMLQLGRAPIARVLSANMQSPDVLCDLAGDRSLRECLASRAGALDHKDVLYAEEPVIVSGSTVGQIAIADCKRPDWSPDVLALLADAAAGIAAELERRIAQAEVARVRALVASHNHVHDMIASATPLRTVLIEICRAIEQYDSSLMPSVLLRDAASNTLHSGIGPSFPKEYFESVDGAPIGPNIGTCGPAAWFGTLCISPDLARDPKWDPIRPIAQLAGVAHCWSMPIKDSNAEVLGTLAIYGREPRRPRAEHILLMQDWVRIAGTAIERARSLDRLKYDARHDSLTGLPNRAAIFEALDGAIQRVEPSRALAVLFVDLDGLKAMNDSLGHDFADDMIKDIAARLAKCAGTDGFVGRFGGDEFIFLTEGIASVADAARLGTRLLEVISQPLPRLDTRAITASIGIAMVTTRDIDAREAIRRADAAMYEAKRTGRDRCVFAEIGESVQPGRRLELARALRGAETRGEMHVVYQPVIALSSGRAVGVEALLRWQSPIFGAIAPSDFIPIAEDTGSILHIGAWALQHSCEAFAKLADVGHGLGLSVNVSARQLSEPEFPHWVRQTLAHAPLPAERLTLELTETSLVRPDAVALNNVKQLSSLGVGLALDDFGTGFSSLAWLRDHRVGVIKIDRSFVSGIHESDIDRAIVRGVIRLAKDIGCTVIAEGVETSEQLETLGTLGCDNAQGYLLARPLPIDQLVEWLARQHPGHRTP